MAPGRRPLRRAAAPLGTPGPLLDTDVGWQGIFPRPDPPFLRDELCL